MTMTLAEILKKVFTEEVGPTGQTSGYDFNDKEHEILGDVPVSVQWLHELGSHLTNETNALMEQAQKAEGAEQDALVSQIKSNRGVLDTLNDLKWKLFGEAFTFDMERHQKYAILKGWKAAATLRSEEEEGDFPDFLKTLFSGEGLVIGVMGMGQRKTQH